MSDQHLIDLAASNSLVDPAARIRADIMARYNKDEA